MFFRRSKQAPTPDWAPLHPRGSIFEVDVDWVRDAPPEVRRVDVREASELEGELGAMPGAAHVPLGGLVSEAASWIDKEAPVVVFCRSGARSARAAASLQKLGFSQVASMRGGMISWRAYVG